MSGTWFPWTALGLHLLVTIRTIIQHNTRHKKNFMQTVNSDSLHKMMEKRKVFFLNKALLIAHTPLIKL